MQLAHVVNIEDEFVESIEFIEFVELIGLIE
jgi:hypothetical protein